MTQIIWDDPITVREISRQISTIVYKLIPCLKKQSSKFYSQKQDSNS